MMLHPILTMTACSQCCAWARCTGLLSDAYRSLLLQLVAVQLISGCAELLLQLQILADVLCSSLKVPRCQCSPAWSMSSSGCVTKHRYNSRGKLSGLGLNASRHCRALAALCLKRARQVGLATTHRQGLRSCKACEL